MGSSKVVPFESQGLLVITRFIALAKTGAACIAKPQQNVTGSASLASLHPSPRSLPGTLRSCYLVDGQLFIRATPETFGRRCTRVDYVFNSGIRSELRDDPASATQSRNSPITDAWSRTECNQGQAPGSARMHSSMLQFFKTEERC